MESSKTPSAWRSAPAITLILLAPVISELLYGGTRLSYLYALISEAGIWGCGALLIRSIARRRNLGWTSMLLLALGLAIAEEFIIQQTSIAPLVGLAKHAYGRVWGVNWVYFLWALGYECVWVVMIPAQITELIFPDRSKENWLSKRGMIWSCVYFLLASYIAWYSWTQIARTKVFHMPPYHPPIKLILFTLASIALLCWVALRLPPNSESKPGEKTSTLPAPWLAGSMAFVLGAPWSEFVLIAYGDLPKVPFGIPIVAGVVWACSAFILIARWSAHPEWGDRHRMALVFGGVVACMIGGFVVFWIGGALPIDWAGKIVTNILALAYLVRLNRQVRTREIVSGSSQGAAGEVRGIPRAAPPEGPSTV